MKNYNRAVAIAALAIVAGRAQAQSYIENFDSVPSLAGAGWALLNRSVPLGATGWYQGSIANFPAQATTGYIGTNYQCGSGLATQNNWLLSPVRTMNNGDAFQFWTRIQQAPAAYADRLQVRLSQAGNSTNTGATAAAGDVGDFSTLLFDINPTYQPTGYPAVWTQYTVTLSGLPAAGVSGRFGFRYYVENGGPSGSNGLEIGIDSAAFTVGGVGSGACCFFDGSCTLLDPFTCSAQGGTYNGNNSTCAAANCQISGYIEAGDAGSLPDTAPAITGNPSSPLTRIRGTIADASDADMFKFQVCNRSTFAATIVGGATFDTQLWLFDNTGRGRVADDDATPAVIQSAITNQFVPANGTYFIAVTAYNRDPRDFTGQLIWHNAPFTTEHAPDGPGASNPIASWDDGTTDPGGMYTIFLTGACFLGASCYANCDNSTAAPILNANDFQCFLNKFAVNDPAANCDNSTSVPILNANDFQCFLNAYATGCTS